MSSKTGSTYKHSGSTNDTTLLYKLPKIFCRRARVHFFLSLSITGLGILGMHHPEAATKPLFSSGIPQGLSQEGFAEIGLSGSYFLDSSLIKLTLHNKDSMGYKICENMKMIIPGIKNCLYMLQCFIKSIPNHLGNNLQ